MEKLYQARELLFRAGFKLQMEHWYREAVEAVEDI